MIYRQHEGKMKTSFFKFSVLLLSHLVVLDGTAAESTLRVACADQALNAEVSLDGKFKGECPLDIRVNAGQIKVTARKKIGPENREFTQTVRMGEGIVKRIEVVFEGADTQAAAAPQFDPRSVARERFAVEMTEYKNSILSCLPKYDTQLSKMRQEVASSSKEHMQACDAFWGERQPNCGWFDENSRILLEAKQAAEKAFNNLKRASAESWCERQFTKPTEPQ
jgi:hypothetical protein